MNRYAHVVDGIVVAVTPNEKSPGDGWLPVVHDAPVLGDDETYGPVSYSVDGATVVATADVRPVDPAPDPLAPLLDLLVTKAVITKAEADSVAGVPVSATAPKKG